MKKFLSIFMALILAFVFVSCSSKEYVDIPVTEVVTDENGETVTDESGQAVVVEVTDKDGNVVTEHVEKSKTTTSLTTTADSSATASVGGADTPTNAGTTTTKKQETNKTTTTTKQTTTKQTTTKPTKPQKRDIKVTLKLPYYNGQETEITVSYKAEGDKKYKDLDPVKTKLDKTNKIQEFTIEDVKGAVSISVSLSGVDITQNTKTVKADEKAVTIAPVTGIEVMEDMD